MASHTYLYTYTGKTASAIKKAAEAKGVNIRVIDDKSVGMSFGETITKEDVADLLSAFGVNPDLDAVASASKSSLPGVSYILVVGRNPILCDTTLSFSLLHHLSAIYTQQNLRRTTPYLTHPIFNSHQSETQMLRYLKKLENKDLSLNTSMISLGSCTMKLNATAEMLPITWPGKIKTRNPMSDE